MNVFRFIAACALAASLAACAQTAQLTQYGAYCAFETIPLETPIPQDAKSLGPNGQSLRPKTLAGVIENSLSAPPIKKSIAGGPDIKSAGAFLAMSGGSQSGAFGAGILDEWNRSGTMPQFNTVTGVSTGAILATFAFTGDTDLAVQGYTIAKEKDLLDVYAPLKSGGRLSERNFLSLARKGAFADLGPMQKRLSGYLTDDVLTRVAEGHRADRRLLVGAINADTGKATAFDMGEMADRWSAAKREEKEAKAALYKDCYARAIRASSSVPLAAKPVFIDNTMYFDGGARFGLFGDTVIEIQNRLADKGGEGKPAPIVYAIVNAKFGTGEIQCPKRDPADCGQDPLSWDREGQHSDWNGLDLALAAESILTDQIFLFSAQAVKRGACKESGCFNFLYLDDPSDSHPFTMDGEGEKSCGEWQKEDVRRDNPIEFHKRYMRCLIDYGRTSVTDAGWAAPQSKGPPLKSD